MAHPLISAIQSLKSSQEFNLKSECELIQKNLHTPCSVSWCTTICDGGSDAVGIRSLNGQINHLSITRKVDDHTIDRPSDLAESEGGDLRHRITGADLP